LTTATAIDCGAGYKSSAIGSASAGFADLAAAVTANICVPCTGANYSTASTATCSVCPTGSEVTTVDGVNTDCN
jgi:hypothetical protein